MSSKRKYQVPVRREPGASPAVQGLQRVLGEDDSVHGQGQLRHLFTDKLRIDVDQVRRPDFLVDFPSVEKAVAELGAINNDAYFDRLLQWPNVGENIADISNKEMFLEQWSDLVDLARTIYKHNIIQPLVVFEVGKGYQIVAGERRFLSSLMAQKKRTPCVLYPSKPDPYQLRAVQLIENLRRDDLSMKAIILALYDLSELQKEQGGDILRAEQIQQDLGFSKTHAYRLYRVVKLSKKKFAGLLKAMDCGELNGYRELDSYLAEQGKKTEAVPPRKIDQRAKKLSLGTIQNTGALRKLIGLLAASLELDEYKDLDQLKTPAEVRQAWRQVIKKWGETHD